MSADYEPVNVHVASVAEGAQLGTAARRKKRYTTKYETFTLTANDPVQCILPEDDNRVIAHIQALDNDVVIGTQGQVAAAANTAANVPQPIGTYVPSKTTGGAIPVYPVLDNNAVYAGVTTTGSNSRVAVTAVACE